MFSVAIKRRGRKLEKGSNDHIAEYIESVKDIVENTARSGDVLSVAFVVLSASFVVGLIVVGLVVIRM